MKLARFVIYPAKDGWRWFLQARNGRTLADSGEAYTTERDAMRAVATVRTGVAGAEVVHVRA